MALVVPAEDVTHQGEALSGVVAEMVRGDALSARNAIEVGRLETDKLDLLLTNYQLDIVQPQLFDLLLQQFLRASASRRKRFPRGILEVHFFPGQQSGVEAIKSEAARLLSEVPRGPMSSYRKTMLGWKRASSLADS